MLKMEQQQRLSLSPQMQQSMKILRMSRHDLIEYIKKEALENPIIELDSLLQNPEEALSQRKQEWLSKQETLLQKNSISYKKEDAAFSFVNRASGEHETLEKHLLEQISYIKLTKRNRAIMEYIVISLDDKGFLTRTPEELSLEIHASPLEIKSAIATIQKLDPIGSASFNFQECLLLQLDPEDELARKLIQTHLIDVAKKRYGELTELLKTSPDELQAAIKRIQELNPKPGRYFSLRQETPYISPDLLIVKFEEEFQIMLCDFYYPNFRINEDYINLSSYSEQKDVKEYINEGIQKFKWMKKSIESRNSTLLNIGKAIVAHQKAFFIHPDNRLKPLRMKDLADQLSVHESTISRGVKDKYLQCSFGTFPLSHFFVTEMIDGSGHSTSTDMVRSKLLKLIEQEDKSAPLSDNALCRLLENDGCCISRRTIAKYRVEMNIPSSEKRF